ncbi:nuclear transport factor 2 family protein [Polaribacter ponticola]|uniref:Nuclear transport factor 2 family protein n=1 Tax=Polaribacter ponticola TaxID=2978475 RepID=A0ABT5S933_9FLAO|nr:nuclear transport factor 2 family protein [Polaribacter sp. MSW5]MDD7914617.1 nuclear transport factor 2 family protein [Polaribacter sp. MSW5]
MNRLILLFLGISTTLFCQKNTEIHVFDILLDDENYLLKNGKNISNNEGYDSQPFFYDLEKILYASNRNGNTEIVLTNINSESKTANIRSNTPNGGEYSPQRIPNSSQFSAVRLDNDGLQRFYKYDRKSKKSTELIPDLKVAYPAWFDKNTVIAVSIVNDSLELFVCDLKKKTNLSVSKNVGRSVHRIPNSNLVSFISKENKKYWLVKSLNPITKEIKTITSVGLSEDVTWLPNGILLISKGNSIYKFNPKKDKYPSLFYSFIDENITNISRIAVNKNGTKLALVAEVSPEYLAQEQLDGYNNRDIDAFLKPYAKNVKVYRFPNKLDYEGLDTMRNRYESYFKNTTDLNCKLIKRIVHKDQVIDHELVTANGRTFKAVAIYKMKNGKIASVTFL